MDNNRYTGIHVLHVTTTIMMANNVNKHSSKELHRSGLRNQQLFLCCMLLVMSPYMTDPALYEKESNKSLCPAC